MTRYAAGMLLAALIASAIPLSANAQVTDQTTQKADAMTPSAREAATTVDAFHAALARNDTSAALELLADDALVFEGGNAERSKAEYASHHAAADAAFSSAVASSLLRRSGHAAGDFAWVASEGRTTGRFKDRPVDRLTTESMLLRREAKGWRIIHIHWSSRAAS
jgi:ketosteroid isomerase-like protein